MTIGGVPAASLKLEELRRKVILVTQEHHVFDASLRDNLALADEAGERLVRQEQDANFDGRFEAVLVFENGRQLRQETDANGDGRPEAIIHYGADGKPAREEADRSGDGTIDFLLTSAWSAIKGPQSGRMYILSGARTDGR